MEYKVTSKQLRKMWLDFYKERGHKDIGSVSLIGDGSTGVMFNVAGMQALMPYLLGEKHPEGTRLCNIQGCVRTIDIDEVGDESHCTFFEMMGNWSLGDYFKKEKTKWSFDLLTKVFGFDGNKICCSVFAGDKNAPRDTETAKLLMEAGIKEENIFYLPKENNWWDLPGTVGTPCGPDNEWFYPTTDIPCGENCGLECDCGRYVEIGNDVYMQFEQLGEGKYRELASKNVDTGFGLERNLIYLNGLTDVYKTDLFIDVIHYLEDKTNIKYNSDEKATRAMRIIADHTRTSTMLIGDKNGIVPSNVGAGYVLRRLLRRAMKYAKSLNLTTNDLLEISKIYINKVFNEDYPLLVEKQDYILQEIKKEAEKFEKTLEVGIKEFNKLVENLKKFAPDNKKISGEKAFRLFDTFGFPLELTIEMAKEIGFVVDEEGFKKAFSLHQEKSHGIEAGVVKGGLAEQNEQTTKLHTATHLLHNALSRVLNSECKQMGSNITSERLRFDFGFDRKLSPEEIKAVEDMVNKAISENIDVVRTEGTVEEAKAKGAIGVFDSKYGDIVSVYAIPGYGAEICGGPHVKNTGELHHFKIVKEESSSSGVRRIKAVLD